MFVASRLGQDEKVPPASFSRELGKTRARNSLEVLIIGVHLAFHLKIGPTAATRARCRAHLRAEAVSPVPKLD